MKHTLRNAAALLLAGSVLAPAARADEKVAAAQAPAASAKPAPGPVKVSAGSDGFVLESEGGDFRLRVGGYAQGDGRFYLGDDAKLGTDTFLLRRARPQLQGTVGKRFDFYFMSDFGGGTATIQDAYVDARFSPLFSVRVGKFKPPVGLERLQSGANIPFVERAAPTSLVPNRDVGIQVHGEAGAGVFAYAVSLQNGTVDGGSSDGDTNDGKDLAARVFAQPFKDGKGALQGLGLGISGQAGKQEGTALPTYRSPGQLAFFSYATGVACDGTRTRLSPQGYYYVGSLGLLGEYAVSRSSLAKGNASAKVSSKAWQAAASFVLTGEKAGWTPLKPAKPFDPSKGQWGALELAVRVHQLTVDHDAFNLGFADIKKSARKATSWAFGLNWYLSRNLKYVFNYEKTSFDGGATAGDRPTEEALLLRAQVLF
jgi:phosphate-selective porin OprO/OprP